MLIAVDFFSMTSTWLFHDLFMACSLFQVLKQGCKFLNTCENTEFFCSAWPRLKVNAKIGLHTTTQTLRQQYLSCYWPDFDQTLNKGSWEHKQQITTVTTTFVQATFILGTFVQISNISISKLTTFDFSLVCILSQNLYYDCVHYQILPPIYMEIDRLHPIWPIDIWPIC